MVALLVLSSAYRGLDAAPQRQDSASATDDWPSLRADAAHSGARTNAGPTGAMSARWKFRSLDPLINPIVVNGVLYIADQGGIVYAMDAATGQQRWRFDLGAISTDAQQFSTPTVEGNTLVVGSFTGTLFALDTADGSVRWTRDFPGAIFNPPVIDGGVVVIGDDGGEVAALDLATGSVRWAIALGVSTSHAGVTVGDGLVFQPTDDAVFHTLDLTTGAEVWTKTLPATQRSPTYVDGVIYTSVRDNTYRALDARTGSELWSYAPGENLSPRSGAYWQGTIVANIDGDSTVGLDAATGAERWRVSQSAYGSTTAIANGVAYMPVGESEVVALDVATGAVVGSGPVGIATESPAAIAGGLLYVASLDGTLTALGAATGTPAADAPVIVAPTATPDATPVASLPATLEWTYRVPSGDGLYDAAVSVEARPGGGVLIVGEPMRLLDGDGQEVGQLASASSGPGQVSFKVDEASGWWGSAVYAPDGTLYVAECGNERVSIFAPDGAFVSSFGSRGDEDGLFLCPAEIAIGKDGDIYVADIGRNDIQRFRPDGTYVSYFEGEGFRNPSGLAVAPDGNVIVVDNFRFKISVFTPDGELIHSFGDPGRRPGMLENPYQAATDAAGNIYVVDERPREITVFDANGGYIGSVELTELTDAEILGAYAIAAGDEGTFYLVAYGGSDPAEPVLTILAVTIELAAAA